MKTLTSKTKLFIFMGVFAAFVLAGALVLGLCGAKLSIDLAGGSKIKVICQEEQEANNAQKLVSDVLAKNNIEIESVSKLSSGAETRVVFVTRNKNISNDVNIAVREAVSGIEFVEVQGFDEFNASFGTKTWVIAVVAIVIGIVAALACYLISKRWADVIAYLVAFATMALLSFALMIITRVEVSSLSLAGLFVGLVVEAIVSALLLVRFRDTKKQAVYENKSYSEVAVAIRKKYVVCDMFVYIAMMIAAIICVAVCDTSGVFFGVELVLGIASTVFAAYFVLLETKSALEFAFENRYQNKLNETAAVQETKVEPAKKSKTARPQASSSAQPAKQKKRKRRNRQDKVVV